MFSIKRTIGSSHISCGGKPRYSAIVDFMQDCSSFQLEEQGKLQEYMENNGLAMFFVSRQIDIDRLPDYGEELTISTTVFECKASYGLRNTFVYDKSGNLCIKGFATGAFVRLSDGRPVKAPTEVTEGFDFGKKFDMEYLPRKIKIPDKRPELSKDIKVSKAHIDVFNHVNNARYIDMAYDVINNCEDVFSRIRVEYKTPLTLNDKAKATLYRENNSNTVVIHNETTIFSVVEFID